MKQTLLFLAFALLAAACASGASVTTTTNSATAPSATVSTSSSTVPPASPSTTADAPSDTTGAAQMSPPEGPPAPDFTTVLASGESYTLSEAFKPVYMVFWAEW